MTARIPALDGLRGLAVIAVVAHHLGHLPGGYLGVDAFFCLSGFLITGLLLDEATRDTGDRPRIALGRFWLRRAHRLLPALVTMLAVVVFVERWVIEGGTPRAGLRDETLAALAYVSNWREIAVGTDYWAQFGAASPLRHMWSLAIEEQFYLAWPLVALAALWWARRGSGRRVVTVVGVIAALLAVGSAALAVVIADPHDSLRVYYGTDTRIAAIALGAAAAACVRAVPPLTATVQRIVGLVAMALVVPVGWAWVALEGDSPTLYRGGLFAVGVASTFLIAAVTVAPHSAVAKALSWGPLRAVGLVSYGLYLWHWPVIVWLTPVRTGLDGAWLLGLRVAVFTAATLLSYRFVEQPVRLGRPGGRTTAAIALPSFAAVGSLAVVAVGSAGISALPAAGTRSAEPIPPPVTTTVAPAAPPVTTTFAPAAPPLTDAPATSAARPTSPAPSTVAATTIAPSTTTSPTAALPHRLMVVGDSGAYFLGAGLEASAPDAEVLQRGEVGCGVANDGEGLWYDNGVFVADPPGCDDWPERWAADAMAFAPDTALVVLAWPGYGDREIDGERRHPCQAEFDEYYAARLDLAIESAGAGGGRVAIASVPPPDAGAKAVGVARLLGDLTVERTACLNSVIGAAAARSGATLVDLAAWTCPGGVCRGEIDGAALRFDGVHFGGAGGAAAAEWILDRLGIATPIVADGGGP